MSHAAPKEHAASSLCAEHIAPCGMNCVLCMAYLREKKPCPGCHGEDDQKPFHCVNCSICHCAELDEGDDGFCFSCGKFPCKRLKQLDKRYREKYHMSLVDNLLQVKTDGMEAFLLSQASKWSCKACGGFVCVHRGYCIKCGP